MGEFLMKFVRFVALAAIVMAPVAAGAGPREDLIEGMAKCAAVADNAARLACYDALNPTLKAAQSTPVPPPPPAAAPPADNRAWYDPGRIFGTSPSQQVRPEQFGAEALTAPTPPPPKPGEPAPPSPPAPIDSITAVVTDYSFNPFGKFVVFLDNGQIWQQLQGESDLAKFPKHDKITVVISRGGLGSYDLTINDQSKFFKVRRIK